MYVLSKNVTAMTSLLRNEEHLPFAVRQVSHVVAERERERESERERRTHTHTRTELERDTYTGRPRSVV